MKLVPQDIIALAKPLVVFGAILAMAAAGVAYTGKLIQQAQTDLAAAEVKLKEARERVSVGVGLLHASIVSPGASGSARRRGETAKRR